MIHHTYNLVSDLIADSSPSLLSSQVGKAVYFSSIEIQLFNEEPPYVNRCSTHPEEIC